MIPDRAVDRHPPLPAAVKGSTRASGAIGDVDDARPPGNPVVPRGLTEQRQELTTVVRDLPDEMRLARVAKSERTAAPAIN
jgi:hypothetical protein